MSTPPRRATLRIPLEHPMFAGHFPAQPIVPGAWLLAQAMAALEAEFSSESFVGIALQSVKFVQPVAPGAILEVSLSDSSGDRRRLEVFLAGAPVLTAILTRGAPGA